MKSIKEKAKEVVRQSLWHSLSEQPKKGRNIIVLTRNGRIIDNREKPVAYLEHKPTKSILSVYTPIGWFKRFMLRFCFGLKYNKG